jgi:hypothetical protein
LPETMSKKGTARCLSTGPFSGYCKHQAFISSSFSSQLKAFQRMTASSTALMGFPSSSLAIMPPRPLRMVEGSVCMTNERIVARRVTLDEFADHIGGLDYINGRMLTDSGIELFVGVEEFAESIRVSEESLQAEKGQG